MASIRSLAETCMQIALQNVQFIPSIAGLPEMYAQELLKAVKTAQQLKELERVDELTPEETAPHWRRLVQKDFPDLVRKHYPDPERTLTTSVIYEKLKKIDQKNKESAVGDLMKAMNARKQEVDNKNVRIVSMGEVKRILPRLPQDGRRGASHWSQSSVTNPSTPRVHKSNILGKARLEARNASKTHRLPPSALRPVTRALAKAPEGMLINKRIESQPKIRTAYRPPPGALESSEAERKRKELESRLLRIKAKSAPKATSADAGSPEESISESVAADEASAGTGALKRKRTVGLLSNAPGANAKNTRGRQASAPRVTASVHGKATTPNTQAFVDDLRSPKRIKTSPRSPDFGPISPPNRKTGTPETKSSSAMEGRKPALSPPAVPPPASLSLANPPSPRTAARRECEAKLSPADRQRLAALRNRKANASVMYKRKR